MFRGKMRSLGAILVVVFGALWAVASGTAFAWGPGIHQDLAGNYYADPLIADFATEAGTNVSAVVSGAGDLDYASSEHKSLYHSGQWTMVQSRRYVYRPGAPDGNVWYNIDETTRLKYMMHNLGDVSVPIGHSPANSVPGAEPNQLKEAFFEGQADVGSYGSPVAPTSWYSGDISQVVSSFYNDCIANTYYFRDNVSTGFLTVTPWANANASAHEAWRISQMLGKAVLADYYLSQLSAADAGSDKIINPGEFALFDAAGLRDPDNITWNTDGSYYDRSDWTGISQVRWDLGSNGVYDYTGLQFTMSYAELLGALGGTTSTTFTIEVLDDEGRLWYDTAGLTLTTPIMGDANNDGLVDTADYTLWADNYGTAGGWNKGNFNGDGIVDTADYTLWADNYNASSLSFGTLGFTAIPEPSSLAILASLLGAAVVRLRRK